MSSDPGNLWGQLILLAVLILINAYFAAAEMAIVSVNKNRIRTLAQEGNKKAKALNELIDEPNKFLSSIQVIITLAGFLTSAEAAISFSDEVSVFIGGFGIPYSYEISVTAAKENVKKQPENRLLLYVT